MIDAAKELGRKHKIVYWTCPDVVSEIDVKEFPGTLFHEHDDALLGIPPQGAAAQSFPPPSSDVIAALYETESTVLTMMNKRFEHMPHTERKRLYLSYVGYWLGVLTKEKPDAVIFPATPHAHYDYVIYAIAKLLKIRTVIIEPIWIKDRMIMMRDYKEGVIFPERHAQVASLESLAPDVQEYYRRAIDPKKDRTPFYMHDQRKRFLGAGLMRIRLLAFWRSLRDATFFTKLWSFLTRKFGENLIKEYRRLESRPDLEKKFVYVALHYQPERTTAPQGGVFVDQILMVETLSAALPEGWRIYVKEHPTQWLWLGNTYFSYRFRGYYERLAALPNVQLVPVETDSFALIGKCRAVATVTGTVGFEAILTEKPALIFGYPWYSHIRGAFKVASTEACAKAFQDIDRGWKAEKSAIIQYLGALDAETFHGFVDDNGKKISSLTTAENAQSVAAVIEKALT